MRFRKDTDIPPSASESSDDPVTSASYSVSGLGGLPRRCLRTRTLAALALALLLVSLALCVAFAALAWAWVVELVGFGAAVARRLTASEGSCTEGAKLLCRPLPSTRGEVDLPAAAADRRGERGELVGVLFACLRSFLAAALCVLRRGTAGDLVCKLQSEMKGGFNGFILDSRRVLHQHLRYSGSTTSQITVIGAILKKGGGAILCGLLAELLGGILGLYI